MQILYVCFNMTSYIFCLIQIDTMINGEPIINLPPKSIGLNKVEFTPEERAFYVRLEERSRQQFKVKFTPYSFYKPKCETFSIYLQNKCHA